MRVAHFVQRYPPALGGSEDYFARLSRYLAAAGDQVTVFTTTAVDLPAFWSTSGCCLRPGRRIEDGVEVRRYHLWHLPYQTRILKALSFLPSHPWQPLTISCNPIAWRMWVECGQARDPFDVVHATAFPYGWPLACARRLARRLGVPFVLTPFLHLGDPADPRDCTRRAYTSPALLSLAHSADRLFVQTEGERQALLDHGISGERLILQGMGLDRESCTGGDRLRARAEWGISPDDVVIGHLANNSREKGSVDLLRAAERAWRQGGRFVVVLAGPEMPNFQSFWRGHRPSGRVIRLGVLDARQKRDFFAAIDVFALPSRSDSFGLVLLEAWANGVPNIGYRAGGIGWVIRDEKDGLLAPCGDINGLAAAMLRLSVDADLRRTLGAAGLERTRHEFEWEDKFKMVRRAYQEVTGLLG
ncbi:MAG TPA: glycosyltransferase family 4 protein [Gemmataceae bacterium]|nr:glycosyltransferase family 4 protein [Gemmataceae bacterium]